MRPLLLTALPFAQALALESATTGSQATQATVGVINSKVDTGLAVLQARLDKMEACEAQRKFYAPSDPKKDANGCVGVGDYDLNMASTSNVNLANGRVYSTQNAASNWGGLFYGPAYGGVYGTGGYYGLYGVATGADHPVGVRGDASGANGWGAYFTGANGVFAQGAVAGEFYGANSGTGGISIDNPYHNAPLCLNGSCITNWRQASSFGGGYGTNDGPYTPYACTSANPYTGGCTCPSGYSASRIMNQNDRGGNWKSSYLCYR